MYPIYGKRCGWSRIESPHLADGPGSRADVCKGFFAGCEGDGNFPTEESKPSLKEKERQKQSIVMK
jgi:hypothetical protein